MVGVPVVIQGQAPQETIEVPQVQYTDRTVGVPVAAQCRFSPWDARVRQSSPGHVGRLDDAGCDDSSDEESETVRILLGSLSHRRFGECLSPECGQAVMLARRTGAYALCPRGEVEISAPYFTHVSSSTVRILYTSLVHLHRP